MKLAMLIGAALLGAAGVTAAPGDAQRYDRGDRYGDYDRGDRHGGYDRDDRYGGDDRYDRGDRNWRDDRGPRHGHGWNRGWGRDRSRVVCRTERSYHGPVRRCFRINR